MILKEYQLTCLVLLIPHSLITQSHSMSPEGPLDRLSSVNFFNLSVSSSDHAPWFPITVPPVAGVVVILAVGCAGVPAVGVTICWGGTGVG